MGVLTKEQEQKWQKWVNKVGRFLTHQERKAERQRWEKKYNARKGSVTYYIKDKITEKEKGITEKEYWIRIREKEKAAAAEVVAKGKAVIKEYQEKVKIVRAERARKAEKKRLGTSWLPEKDAAVKARIKDLVGKYGYGGRSVIPTIDAFPLKAVIIVMVGIGAAALYLMRRKK